MRVKLQAIKQELRRRMHQPIPEQGKWLKQVVTGYFNYHAVPTNAPTLTAFRFHSPTYGDARCGGEVRRIGRPGNGSRGWPTIWLPTANPSPLANGALQSNTQGKSRMP